MQRILTITNGDDIDSTWFRIIEMMQTEDDCPSKSNQRINANDNAFAMAA